jgi:membrane-associated phospholipid phosphatase
MAATVFMRFPKRRGGCLAIAYALYIGIAVSTTIHWFSDFAAGAIVGATTGTVVGSGFLRSETRLR